MHIPEKVQRMITIAISKAKREHNNTFSGDKLDLPFPPSASRAEKAVMLANLIDNVNIGVVASVGRAFKQYGIKLSIIMLDKKTAATIGRISKEIILAGLPSVLKASGITREDVNSVEFAEAWKNSVAKYFEDIGLKRLSKGLVLDVILSKERR